MKANIYKAFYSDRVRKLGELKKKYPIGSRVKNIQRYVAKRFGLQGVVIGYKDFGRGKFKGLDCCLVILYDGLPSATLQYEHKVTILRNTTSNKKDYPRCLREGCSGCIHEEIKEETNASSTV